MYKKHSDGWLKHADFILLDMICLQIAFVLAYGFSGYGYNPYGQLLYRGVAFFLELANLVVIFAYDTMKNVLKRGYYREFQATLNHSIMVGALVILYLFLIQKGQNFSRLTMIFTVCIYTLLTYIVRIGWKKLIKKKRKTWIDRRLMVVTSADIADQVIQNLQPNDYDSYLLTGAAVIGTNWKGKNINGVPVVADETEIPMYVCNEWVDEVLLIISEAFPYPEKLIEQLTQTGVTIHLNLAKITNIPEKRQFVEKMGGYTVLTMSMNFASPIELALKRLMDICGGLIGCLLTGIIFLFVAPAIYVASPGPIFFAQERVGKNGKKFKMYKFRSMYMDAEKRKAELMKDNKLGDGKMFKLDFDPRVIGNKILSDGTRKTGIGDFIRRTSLDEFPQFFNVLKGDMSIVGTRPPLLSETALYELRHHARLVIKPGITGMWQVSGRSDITDFEEVVRLDREYIENWNLGMDIKILLKTVLVVFRKDGSV